MPIRPSILLRQGFHRRQGYGGQVGGQAAFSAHIGSQDGDTYEAKDYQESQHGEDAFLQAGQRQGHGGGERSKPERLQPGENGVEHGLVGNGVPGAVAGDADEELVAIVAKAVTEGEFEQGGG